MNLFSIPLASKILKEMILLKSSQGYQTMKTKRFMLQLHVSSDYVSRIYIHHVISIDWNWFLLWKAFYSFPPCNNSHQWFMSGTVWSLMKCSARKSMKATVLQRCSEPQQCVWEQDLERKSDTTCEWESDIRTGSKVTKANKYTVRQQGSRCLCVF